MCISAIALSALTTLNPVDRCPAELGTTTIPGESDSVNPSLPIIDRHSISNISNPQERVLPQFAPPEISAPEVSASEVSASEVSASETSVPVIATPEITPAAISQEDARLVIAPATKPVYPRLSDDAPATRAMAPLATVLALTPSATVPTPLSSTDSSSPELETPLESETISPEDIQAELGEIRILPSPPQLGTTPPAQPNVQLLLRSGAFSSDNITAVESFRRGDTVFYNSATLLATPKLGPTTRLVASVSGGLFRYAQRDESDYNQVTWDLGIQQQLSPALYLQIGGGQDRLYQSGSGAQLLRENALHLTVGRQDRLGKRLRLDSSYNLRASFANLETQSQVSHTLGTRLRYDISPSFQAAIDYRLTFKDFTETERFDTEHQVGATAIYAINPRLFVAGSVSYLFGRSSNATAEPNNLAVGLSIGLNVPLF